MVKPKAVLYSLESVLQTMRQDLRRVSVRSAHPAPWGFENSVALFDRVTRLAKSLFSDADASVILVENGVVWRSRRADELPVDDPVSEAVLRSGELLWVADGRLDPEMAAHPLVTGPPYLRFTASMPIRLPNGAVPGVISVSGVEPQPFDPAKAARLKDLADIVVGEWIRAQNEKALSQSLQERDLALERLKESEANYRLLADNQTDVIIRYDPDGTIVFASPSVRQFGYEPEALIGRNMESFSHPEDAERTRRTRAAVADGVDLGPSPNHIFRAPASDGRWIWAEGNPSPIRDKDGTIIGVVTSLRDITARMALEDELRRRQAEAEASSQAKAEFLANMTHELRTPLNAIVGFCGILKDAPDLKSSHARYVDLVWTASQTLLSIVNDVLEFSKLEAGAVEFETGDFDPKSITQATAALLSGQAMAKGLTITLHVDGPQRRLLGDASRLRQVLTNLISNAVKFTAEGEVQIRVSQKDEGDRSRLRVAVKDSGIGVARDQIDVIFARFAQADASVSRKFGGTGLGLAISKRIIEAMGGEIGADSDLGRGSTFWFEVALPIAPGAPKVDAAKGPEASVDGALRVLVVDDNEVNLELICALLELFDIAIETAGNGVEAIDKVSKGEFDVVLMDVQMPTMDGLSATRCIREAETPEGPRVPIVAMTANVLPDQVARCLEAGMDDHIGKPINPTTLLETLARWSAVGQTKRTPAQV